jgi:hypothetical protein
MHTKTIIPLIIIILSCSSTHMYSQKVMSGTGKDSMVLVSDSLAFGNPSDSIHKTLISPFIELMGKGFFSVNVDFRFRESHALSIGIQPFEGLLPNVMYYYLCGKRHRIEIGTGLSAGFSKGLSLEVLLYHGVVGYRYQKKSGLFFRAGFTPLYIMFLNDPDRNKFYPFPGLSLGYCF